MIYSNGVDFTSSHESTLIIFYGLINLQTYFSDLFLGEFFLLNKLIYMIIIQYPFKAEFIRSTILSSFGLIPVKPYI